VPTVAQADSKTMPDNSGPAAPPNISNRDMPDDSNGAVPNSSGVDYNMILRLRLSFIFNSLDYCLTFSYQFGFHWP
jgi:hypothetical protein